MTDESGSRRYPSAPGTFTHNSTNYPAEWETHRTLDPVRAAALTAAVQLTNGAHPPDPGMPVAKHVTELAALLAQYLTG